MGCLRVNVRFRNLAIRWLAELADEFGVRGADFEQAGGGSAGFAHAVFPFDEGGCTHAEEGGEVFLGHAAGFAQGLDAAGGALLAVAGGGDDEGVWLGERGAVIQAIGDVDFRAFVEVAGDFVRGIAVRAIAVQIGQGANVAVVFVAPADEARVASGEGLYFFECYFFHCSVHGIEVPARRVPGRITPPCLSRHP